MNENFGEVTTTIYIYIFTVQKYLDHPGTYVSSIFGGEPTLQKKALSLQSKGHLIWDPGSGVQI